MEVSGRPERPVDRGGGAPVPPYWLPVAVAAAMVIVIGYADELGRSPKAAAAVALAAGVTGLVTVARVVPERALTFGLIYLFIFLLFHGGLLPYVVMGSQPRFFTHDTYASEASWFFSPLLAPAVTAVTLGVLAFLLGYTTVVVRARGGRCPRRPHTPAATTRMGRLTGAGDRGRAGDQVRAAEGRVDLGLVGLVLLAAGVAGWCTLMVEHGPLFFLTMSYVEFRRETRDVPLPAIDLAVGLGMAALGMSDRARLRRLGIGLFAGFALQTFLVGNRGEVIIPALAWLVAAARRRNLRFRPWYALVPVVALAVGSLIRQVRLTGLADLRDNVTPDPFAGLAELGFTLRPLVLVTEWHSPPGQPFVGWGTYLAPLERLLLGRLLGQEVTPVGVDGRVFITFVADQAGPIGGSPVAEAYHAAGLTGVVVVMALIGAAVGWLDTRPIHGIWAASTGIFAYVLLIWVRNDFTPVPAQVAGCLLILGTAVLAEASMAAVRRGRPGGRGRTRGGHHVDVEAAEDRHAVRDAAQERVLSGPRPGREPT